MFLQILRVEEPSHVLFCFDADEDTFRHIEYKEYKSGRQETPDDFYPQVPRALRVIDAFHVPCVSGNRFEADDFAAAYATAAVKEGMRVTIVSGDRDLFQLASGQIRIAVPHKGYQEAEYFGAEEVVKKFGVTPAQIPSYKGLVGDASDNLPGVHGIGPVAAAKLLQEFGTLQEIYSHLDRVKSAWRTKLEAGREQAFFCEKLARLVTQMTLPVPLSSLALRDVHADDVRTVFRELEFVLLTKRLEALLQSEYGKRVFRSVPGSHVIGGEIAPSVDRSGDRSDKKIQSDQMQLL
jgi:DNA polymerase-1